MPTMHYFIDPCLMYFTAKNQIEISFPQLILKTKVIKFLKRMFCLGGFWQGGFCPGGFCPGVYVRGVFVWGVFVLEPVRPITVWLRFFSNGQTNLALLPPPMFEVRRALCHKNNFIQMKFSSIPLCYSITNG